MNWDSFFFWMYRNLYSSPEFPCKMSLWVTSIYSEYNYEHKYIFSLILLDLTWGAHQGYKLESDTYSLSKGFHPISATVIFI